MTPVFLFSLGSIILPKRMCSWAFDVFYEQICTAIKSRWLLGMKLQSLSCNLDISLVEVFDVLLVLRTMVFECDVGIVNH